jgi:hypothetical protein
MTDINIIEEQWFHDPFTWYEETTEQQVVSLKISDTAALDILQGLYDVYINLQKTNYAEAMEDLEVMATIIIGYTKGCAQEVIEELLVEKVKDNMDEFLDSLLKERNTND